MRIIVYGVGAIGGVLAVSLSQAGHEIVGIARGAQLEAIRRSGLLLRMPDGEERAEFECVGDPSEIDFRPDDAILLTMKTQDTQVALERLRAAGVTMQPVFCAQNGIANDDMALRLFPNVFSVVVELPADYSEPGVVTSYFAPVRGVLHVGRHGTGSDEAGKALADAFNGAGFAAFFHADILPLRYAKLTRNLGNAVSAVIADRALAEPYVAAAQTEAREVFSRAGIVPADIEMVDGGKRPELREVPGVTRMGSSSAQSLLRGAGSIETDYLNGEIVLMGRRLGVATPVNAWFAERAHRLLREEKLPGSVPIEDIRAALPGIG